MKVHGCFSTKFNYVIIIFFLAIKCYFFNFLKGRDGKASPTLLPRNHPNDPKNESLKHPTHSKDDTKEIKAKTGADRPTVSPRKTQDSAKPSDIKPKGGSFNKPVGPRKMSKSDTPEATTKHESAPKRQANITSRAVNVNRKQVNTTHSKSSEIEKHHAGDSDVNHEKATQMNQKQTGAGQNQTHARQKHSANDLGKHQTSNAQKQTVSTPRQATTPRQISLPQKPQVIAKKQGNIDPKVENKQIHEQTDKSKKMTQKQVTDDKNLSSTSVNTTKNTIIKQHATSNKQMSDKNQEARVNKKDLVSKQLELQIVKDHDTDEYMDNISFDKGANEEETKEEHGGHGDGFYDDNEGDEEEIEQSKPSEQDEKAETVSMVNCKPSAF